jgi:hypothetical protein
MVILYRSLYQAEVVEEEHQEHQERLVLGVALVQVGPLVKMVLAERLAQGVAPELAEPLDKAALVVHQGYQEAAEHPAKTVLMEHLAKMEPVEPLDRTEQAEPLVKMEQAEPLDRAELQDRPEHQD